MGEVHVGIDASNIRSGGGVTHLKNLLAFAEPGQSQIDRVTVWSGSSVAVQLPHRDWLSIQTPSWCDKSLPIRIFGQQILLPKMVKTGGCSILFSPGGTLPGISHIPMVSMSQNMLPFEPDRAALFGRLSLMRLKLALLRLSQSRSFRKARGLIFLTNYAKRSVLSAVGNVSAASTEIPHGIESRFKHKPIPQRSLADCSKADPWRILYVSVKLPYKHQLEVMQAVSKLRMNGLDIRLDLVGASIGRYGHDVTKLQQNLDPENTYLHTVNHVPFDELHSYYHEADVFLFASSCENLPNILIEAMAAGLPVISSDRGPMPEILGNAAIYFNPEDTASIANAIKVAAENPDHRTKIALEGWHKAVNYSWEKCARETFDFLSYIALHHK